MAAKSPEAIANQRNWKRTSFCMGWPLWRSLQELAAENGTSASAEVRIALERHIERERRSPRWKAAKE